MPLKMKNDQQIFQIQDQIYYMRWKKLLKN